MSKIQIWNEMPSKPEVEAFIKSFFKTLQSGDLQKAQSMMGHAYPDWNESIYTTWQDHYLIHEIPKDSSYEGGEWKTDLKWLKDLTIQDKIEWMKDDLLWVDFLFRGQPSGYIGEFAIKKNDEGYFIQRNIFRMA